MPRCMSCSIRTASRSATVWRSAMTASRRERRFRLASLLVIPFLIAASLVIGAWRNIGEYMRRTELSVTENDGGMRYAGATWTLQQARLIGDGRDTTMRLPNGMRLIIVRLSAHADEDIGENWILCNLTLTD